MKILRNYFLKEFLGQFLLSLAAITLVMVLGNFAKLSDMVVRKGIPLNTVAKLFLYFIPYLLKYSLPLACLMGMLLASGRLNSDNEITAIKTLGISPLKLLSVYITLGILITLLLIIINDRLVPYAHYNSMKIIKSAGKKNITSFIEPGKFSQFNNMIIFAQDTKRNKLKKVFIYRTAGGENSNIIFAERGEFAIEKNILKIKLEDGFIQNPRMQYRIQYKTQFMDIPLGQEISRTKRKTCDMSLKELKREINALKRQNLNNVIPLEIELHDKISFSFSALIFIILGFGLGTKIRHRSRGINFGLSSLIALLYYLSYLGAKALSFKGFLPPALGMWIPNFIFLAVGLFFTYKACVY